MVLKLRFTEIVSQNGHLYDTISLLRRMGARHSVRLVLLYRYPERNDSIELDERKKLHSIAPELVVQFRGDRLRKYHADLTH